MTQLLPPDQPGIALAAALLRDGLLVAFPTETVYGLGGDARSDRAVAAIFAAKNRPVFNPLIVHVANLAQARQLAVFGPLADRLASAFWPGPLTMVLPLRPDSGLSPLVTAGLPTVAIRLPAHPVAQGLLGQFGGPLAAPSANPSGRVSPTRAAHVMSGLAGRIAAVMDGGTCTVGVESTIIGLGAEPSVQRPVLLRPGGLATEVIEAALGSALASPPHSDRPSAPGQLASHYAPEAALRLNADAPQPGEVFVGFGPVPADFALSLAGDLSEAAQALFHILRAADALAGPGGRVAISAVPEHGLGQAINDRLRRAAAPRPGIS